MLRVRRISLRNGQSWIGNMGGRRLSMMGKVWCSAHLLCQLFCAAGDASLANGCPLIRVLFYSLQSQRNQIQIRPDCDYPPLGQYQWTPPTPPILVRETTDVLDTAKLGAVVCGMDLSVCESTEG